MIGAGNLNTEAVGLLNCRRHRVPLPQIDVVASGGQLRQSAAQVIQFLPLATTGIQGNHAMGLILENCADQCLQDLARTGCDERMYNLTLVSGDLNLLRTQSSSFSPETLMYMFQVISEAKTK